MSVDEQLSLAVARHQAGNLGDAMAGYRQVLALQPGHPKATHLLGCCLWEQGHLDQAAALIGQAAAAAPTDADAARDLAAVQWQRGETEQAIQAYRRTLALRPNQPDCAFDLAELLRGAGRGSEALEAYRQALALDPKRARFHLHYGSALLAEQQPAEAAKAFQRACALDPSLATAHHGLGVTAELDKRLSDAEGHYRAAIAADPRLAIAHFDLANLCRATGRPVEAERLYRTSLALDPAMAEAANNLGVLLLETGRREEAIAEFARAEQINPQFQSPIINRGNALRASGRLEDAVEAYRRALSLQPDVIAAMNLTAVLTDLERGAEAVETARLAQRLAPDDVEVMVRLADALVQSGETGTEPAVLYRRALLAGHNDPATTINLGRLLVIQQKWEEVLEHLDRETHSQGAEASIFRSIALRYLLRHREALAAARDAVERDPTQASAHLAEALALQALGQFEDAVLVYQRMGEVCIDKDQAKAGIAMSLLEMQEYDQAIDVAEKAGSAGKAALALALQRRGRKEDALEAFHGALEDNPVNTTTLMNLGNLFREMGRIDEAVEAYGRALAIDPNNTRIRHNRANTLLDLGKVEQGIDELREVIKSDPSWIVAHSNLIFNLGYDPRATLEELSEERKRWWARHGAPVCPANPVYAVTKVIERPLRVGYVSADLRNHVVGYVAASFLPYHDRSQIETVCYHHTLGEDDMTERFRACAVDWRRIERKSDADVAEMVRADRIDILIDLSGHTAGNRLPVFARKPAPVQGTGWGALGGTGLESIDYLFVDPVLIPHESRSLIAETVVDLPAWIAIEPPAQSPAVADLPSLWGRPFTFGSFNRLAKLTQPVFDLWARILLAVPDSQLLVKAPQLNSLANREMVIQEFAKRGVATERLELRGSTARRQHLEAHKDIDLLLDPYPQNGGITTLESLWMGVPVITQLGRNPASRATGAIQAALGLTAFNAADEQDYLGIAVEWSERIDDLREIRLGLRQQMSASPLVGGPAYTRAIEAAYREVWRRWCATQ
ncbi:MAG: tetratricopeptide repeat protein [Alphaproteobacteria bacterium]|nr:tetratricopeptide repeat protein [Alphaproteobacteria bacterium]